MNYGVKMHCDLWFSHCCSSSCSHVFTRKDEREGEKIQEEAKACLLAHLGSVQLLGLGEKWDLWRRQGRVKYPGLFKREEECRKILSGRSQRSHTRTKLLNMFVLVFKLYNPI
jgi:hypothetical protein